MSPRSSGPAPARRERGTPRDVRHRAPPAGERSIDEGLENAAAEVKALVAKCKDAVATAGN
jgi:hypothetical protein